MPRPDNNNSKTAEIAIICKDLDANQGFFGNIGFHLMSIFPADDPREVLMSGFGLNLRLVRSEADSNGVNVEIRIPEAKFEKLLAPCGAKVVFTGKSEKLVVPKPELCFLVNHSNAEDNWVEGRAGMRYRDLIPGRLGSYLIASHIHVRHAGPVPDYVHHHDVVFQLIFCRNGWARLVYEDQGDPFVFEVGDCVLQPPGIRHRVLECSENLEVIEVSCPAEHVTYADNEIKLPNGFSPERYFNGQRFMLSRASETDWVGMPEKGMKFRETGIGKAANGIADARVLRSAGSKTSFHSVNSEAAIYFILSGSCSLICGGETGSELKSGDTVTIPRNMPFEFLECSDNLEMLEINISADN